MAKAKSLANQREPGQLQKMGILAGTSQPKTVVTVKRKSGTLDLSTIQPLKGSSTVKNFTGYRDAHAAKHSVLRKLTGKRKDDSLDSDMDDDDDQDTAIGPNMAVDDVDTEREDEGRLLSPEDAARQERLAEGVQKINLVSFFYFPWTLVASCCLLTELQLKRQASAEPLSLPPASSMETQKSPSPVNLSEVSPATSVVAEASVPPSSTATKLSATDLPLDATIASPFKRARASASGPGGDPVDVSAAKRAFEIFGNTLFPASGRNAAEPAKLETETEGEKSKMEEEL
jgi:hypothetical protein